MQPEQNYKKAESFIRSAAAQSAELVVLPEYHLSNWVPHEPGFFDLCDQWEVYLNRYCALAKECSINIVPGTILERHTGNTASTSQEVKLLNCAYFISSTGSIQGRYIKKNLWHPEREHLTSSTFDAHQVFDTPLGKVGLLVCWDLAFGEAFRELITQGAKLIIIPSFWTLQDCIPEGLAYNPSAEALFLDSFLTTRCFENTCAIIFANAGGPPGKGYAGLSQVCIPFVGPITRLGSAAEGMSIVDLDMGVLEIAEKNYGVRADLAREDWHYSYRHDRTAENDDNVG
jgi:predicted amidohydrolase